MKLSLSTAIPEPSPETVETLCQVDGLVFDQDGLGETPNNRNVRYKGFAALMPVRTFLELAAPGDRSNDAKRIAALIRNGRGIASPFLELDAHGFFDAFEEGGDPPPPKVVGHEGRVRATAALMLGYTTLLVHVFAPPYRARHFDATRLHLLNRGVEAEASADVVPRPFQAIYCGQVIDCAGH